MLKNAGCRVVYDVGWSDDLSIEELRDVLSAVYLFSPNEKEVLKLTGADSVRSALLKLAEYVEHPIVKLGKEGALFLCQGEVVHVDPVDFDNIVDTTGAGDAFFGWCHIRPTTRVGIASLRGIGKLRRWKGYHWNWLPHLQGKH